MACQGAMVDDYCWLPEEFPEEVFFLGEEEEKGGRRASSTPGGAAAVELQPLLSSFPSEFPYDVDSSLSPSPLGSAAGTDSDEEEYEELVSTLTQKMMARPLRLSTGPDDGGIWPPPSFVGDTHKRSVGMRQYSPQSTLSPAGSWTAGNWTALRGCRSPTDHDYLFLGSRKRGDSALDLLSAAALEVDRMRLNEGAVLRRALAADGRGLLPGPNPHSKCSGAGVVGTTAPLNKPGMGSFFSSPGHTHQQLQSSQQPQQRPIPAAGGGSWCQRQNRGSAAGSGFSATRALSGGGSSYACPPSTWSLPVAPQQHHQTGMRAVFLGGAGTRRESSGTGVFLPRRDGNPPPSKKKPAACSTVLLPARVVQALNLNLDEIGALPVSHGAGFVLNSDVIRSRTRTMPPQQTQQQQQQQLLQQQRILTNAATAGVDPVHHYPDHHHQPNPHRHLPGATKPASAWSQEIRLPPEWSY